MSAIAFAQLLNPQWTAKLVKFQNSLISHNTSPVESTRGTVLLNDPTKTTHSSSSSPITTSTATANATTAGDDVTPSPVVSSGSDGSGGVCWNTGLFDGDPEREAYHAKKMASKDARPAAQMAVVGMAVPAGTVLHMTYQCEH